MQGQCLNCGTEFSLWRCDRKYCCLACKDAHHIRERREAIALYRISLDLLKAVYRNNQLPLPTRMRAAIAALPFESPKLSVVANIGHHELGDRLERAIARSMQSTGFVLPRPASIIDAEPVTKPDHRLVPAPPTRGGFRRRF